MQKKFKKDPTYATLGKTETGEDYSVNLSSGPHWLMGGTTGSGKSEYLRNILKSIISNATPDDLSIVIVDPKRVEYTSFIYSPFMLTNPITNVDDFYAILAYLKLEMDIRYDLLESNNVKNIDSYNELMNNYKMKHIVVVIDELYLLGSNSTYYYKNIEPMLEEIILKSRAIGISILISSSRPSIQIINLLIKSNISSRIGLKVTSKTDSEIIIGEHGLEKLQNCGDSIVKNGYDNSLVKVHNDFIPEKIFNEELKQINEKYSPIEQVDYKQILVDNNLFVWVEEYDENVLYKDKHVEKIKIRGGLSQ